MTRQYFGTDGIRGTVGQPPITPDFMLRLAHAVGRVLKRTEARPTVLIGKDTRISGYMLESALESGFNSAGVDVVLLGPLPTPGVAYLTRAQRASLGVVISASHNPFDDNGIKFFSAKGSKLPDVWEQSVEEALAQPPVWVLTLLWHAILLWHPRGQALLGHILIAALFLTAEACIFCLGGLGW